MPEETPELTEVPVPVQPPKLKVIRYFGESMSPEIGDLFGALAKAQGAMKNGVRDKAAHNYSYMELDQLIDIARPALSENGLAIIQSHEVNMECAPPTIITHTTLGHSSGQWHRSSLELPITASKMLSKVQIAGVAMTYGRRYAIQALCFIASEKDTDGSVKTAETETAK